MNQKAACCGLFVAAAILAMTDPDTDIKDRQINKKTHAAVELATDAADGVPPEPTF